MCREYNTRLPHLHGWSIFWLQEIAVRCHESTMACIVLGQAQPLHSARLIETQRSIQCAAGQHAIVQCRPERALLPHIPGRVVG